MSPPRLSTAKSSYSCLFLYPFLLPSPESPKLSCEYYIQSIMLHPIPRVLYLIYQAYMQVTKAQFAFESCVPKHEVLRQNTISTPCFYHDTFMFTPLKIHADLVKVGNLFCHATKSLIYLVLISIICNQDYFHKASSV